MATAMDIDTQLPFRPFSLDTRNCVDGENRHKHMEFIATFLRGMKMTRYEQYLKNVTYKELLNISDIFWTGIEEDIHWDEDETISKPAEGGKMNLSRVITQMKQRNVQLLEYNKELVDSVKVEKLDEILKYFLRISNYPMEPATDGNVAGYICKMLDKVLDILQKNPHTRVGYFFTICAIILDLICGLNYVPFKGKYRMLNALVRKLNIIAEKTGNLEHIRGQGENEKEIKLNKEAKFKLVKYFYIKTKGTWQDKQAKINKATAHKTLTEFISSQQNDTAVTVVADQIDVPYAQRGHQSDCGSSLTVTPPKQMKLSQDSNKNHTIFVSLFYKQVLKNKMPLEVLLSHKKHLPANMHKRINDQMRIESRKISHTSHEYYQLPEDIAVITVKNDSDLENMIKDLEAKEVDSIGVDTESYIFDQSLQLIQIATKNACFLIRWKYVNKLTMNLLKKLGTVLSTKLIIFFAGSNDSEQLSKFIPGCEFMNMLDLQILLDKVDFQAYTINKQVKQKPSLSDCVEEWMKKPLNKDYRLSDWGTEGELSHEQVMYAALDAWVLVPLFEAIQKDQRFTNIEQCIRQSKFLSQTVDSIDVTL